MGRKGVRRSVVFGSLAAAAVGLFVFNLNQLLSGVSSMRLTERVLWTGLAAVFLVALFVWSIVAAVREVREEPEPEAPTSQEKWEEKYPKPAREPEMEKPKEKHGPGYWAKEFLRLAGIPVLLILAIWLGSYYFFLGPLQECMRTSGKAEITLNEEKNKYDLRIDGVVGTVYADSVVEEEPVSLFGYQVPDRPEGYTWIVEEFQTENMKHNYNVSVYRDEEGHKLCIAVWCLSWSPGGYSVSLDEASHWEELTVNDCPGVLVEYESGAIELAWIDARRTNFLSIRADALSLEQIQAMARDFVFMEDSK